MARRMKKENFIKALIALGIYAVLNYFTSDRVFMWISMILGPLIAVFFLIPSEKRLGFFSGKAKKVYQFLGTPLILLCFILNTSVIADFKQYKFENGNFFIFWKYALAFAILFCLIALSLRLFSEFKSMKTVTNAALTLVLAFFIGCGWFANINYLMDTNEPTEHISTVGQKHFRKARRKRSARYEVTLSLYNENYRFVISRDMYSKIEFGDKVIMYHKNGALGEAFYYILPQ